MKMFKNLVFLVFCFAGLSANVMAEDDCKKVKAKTEQALKDKGDSSSYVRIFEVDENAEEGKKVAECGKGYYKVVVFEVSPS